MDAVIMWYETQCYGLGCCLGKRKVLLQASEWTGLLCRAGQKHVGVCKETVVSKVVQTPKQGISLDERGKQMLLKVDCRRWRILVAQSEAGEGYVFDPCCVSFHAISFRFACGTLQFS